jgi:RHS repeat-associated protein
VQGYSFSPFGVPLGESGGEPYGFTGEWWDAEVELLYLRARYMQPRNGVFLSRDPVRGKHPYQYAEANPVNLADPTGLYSMKEIKQIFNNASVYDPDVLGYFRPGGPLEGRWGWLEVLRTAENGDQVAVIDRIGGCAPEPNQPWVSGPEVVRQDIGGVFQKTGSELLIGGDPHLQVASEGHRYQIQKNMHCIANYPYPDICGPYVQNWALKANVNATYQYMWLRRDPALTDPNRLTLNILALVTPKLLEESGKLVGIGLEELGKLIGTGIEVVEGTSRRDMAGVHREVTLFLMEGYAKNINVWLLIGTEIIDLGDDVGDILESAGYRWVP